MKEIGYVDPLPGKDRLLRADEEVPTFLIDLPNDFASLTGTLDIQLTEQLMRGCPESIKRRFRAPTEVVPQKGY